MKIEPVFDALLARYGPQAWWPAQTPFEVMVGAILVQQTAWSNAAKAIEQLREADLLACNDLATASLPLLENLVRPAGFYRTKARRIRRLAGFVEEAGGPAALETKNTRDLRATLLSLDGIGPETADAILLYAFERPVFVVDTYARRLFERLSGRALGTDGELKRDVEQVFAGAEKLNELHALIVEHGKSQCRKRPMCEGCCLRAQCGYEESRLTSLPQV